MDQLIYASLSHTHYWYEVGMLKVPAYCGEPVVDLVGSSMYSVPASISDMMLWTVVGRGVLLSVGPCITYPFVVNGAVVKQACVCALSVVGSERSFRLFQDAPQTYQNKRISLRGSSNSWIVPENRSVHNTTISSRRYFLSRLYGMK